MQRARRSACSPAHQVVAHERCGAAYPGGGCLVLQIEVVPEAPLAGEAGKTVVAVPPTYTSQVCSGATCGVPVCRKGCPFGGMRAPLVAPACIGTTTPRAASCAWAPSDAAGTGQARQALTQPVGAYVA